MQEKKNKRLLGLLVVLVFAVVGATWLSSRDGRSPVNKQLFSDLDLKEVSQVTLQSGDDTIVLRFNGGRWTVNEKFAADPSMIEVLFATLQQAEPKRPLAASQRDSIAAHLKDRGVKVSLSANDIVVKSFFAGGNGAKSQAYFVASDQNVPYLMNIPGYRVYVSGIFELNESGWREKRVFAFNWRNFQLLEATYPSRKTDNFSVSMQNQYFSIAGMQAVDTTKLNDFLDNVSLLTADEFIGTTPQLDSLSTSAPIATLKVTDIAGRQYSWSVFPPINKGEYLPALITGGQWAIFHQNKIEGVVRPRSFFSK
jgi:hypothetical protein